MSKRNSNSIIAFAVVLIVVIMGLFFSQTSKHMENQKVGDGTTMTVSFLDVGQGDCELISLPDGKLMLIDSGEAEYSEKVIDTLNSYGCEKIDFLVITHPHTDHMGGMSEIINTFEIGEIYMPKVSASTRTFENLLQTIADNSLSINTANAGKTIYSEGLIDIKLLSPCSESYDETNNYSAVVKLTYDEKSFLFTGDAEKEAEQEMLANCYSDLDCDVLKVSHHASRYSTSSSFLSAVAPDYAVIEVGADNPYGHPHQKTLDRLNDAGVQVYRTDISGDITFLCDGKSIQIEE